MVTFLPLVSIVITLARLSRFPWFPRQQEGTCSHLNQPPPGKVGHTYHPTPNPIHTPYQEKEQGRPPTDTATSLPALRWLPSMPIQVPPERGPRAGLTR